MKIPDGNYTFDSFLQYLADNEMRVFGGGTRKQWLKVYLVYVMADWTRLFSDFSQTKLGDLVKLTMQVRSLSKPVDFYVHEWSPGLLVFLTSSRREEYEKSLQRFIRFNRGITEMWIPRYLLTNVRRRLLDEYQAVIYSFIGRRSRFGKVPTRLREDVDRRLSYTGEDATHTLKEVQDVYGISPNSMSFRVGSDKLQVTSKGMLLLRSVNERTIRILKELLPLLTESQRKVRDVSSSLRRETRTVPVGNFEIKTPVVVPGLIQFQNTKLDKSTVERFFRQEAFEHEIQDLETSEEGENREFSFIDTSIHEGSFSFSATVVDDIKGTMFGVSGSADRMILVPMHRTTFESFVRFFRLVIDSLDEEAKIDVLEPTASR